MRTLLVMLLVGLLSFCPALCGAAEAGHDAHGHGTSQDPASPTHCPDDGDNCICQGALVSSNANQGSPLDMLGVPLDFASLNHILFRPLAAFNRGGPPTGFAPWGDALGVCALLQIFRC